MDKLQYESLYKFLVSLGIVLIVLPLAAIVFLLNIDPILISQTEFDALSQYSQQMIVDRNLFTTTFNKVFPWGAVVSVLFGALTLIYGIYKWRGVQNDLDKKLNAEATMEALNLLEMSSKEIQSKVEDEVKEDISFETGNETSTPNENVPVSSISGANRYQEIEDLCYKYVITRYSPKYKFKRNIRMGRYTYDFIGVSQNDNIDIIVEVKYFTILSNVQRRLHNIIHFINDGGVSYETIAHRNYKILILLVTPKEQLPELERLVELYIEKYDAIFFDKVEIKSMAEEALE